MGERERAIDTNKALGFAMGCAAALVGGSWQVATRMATTQSAIGPADLAILRYAIPVLLLLPILLRTGCWPRQASKPALLGILFCAGLPFGLIAMTGTRYAPASHMGVLMAGASPLIAALLAWILWHERPDHRRGYGLALMMVGVLLLGAKSIADWNSLAWRGDALFLAAAALWAGYTLSFRRTGLTPWQAAALVNAWSAIFVVGWAVLRGGTALLDAPLHTLVVQAAWQGVLAGVLGLWTYSVAITRLGAAQAAAFGALAPAVSALGGWYWLHDPFTSLDAVAVACAMAGVWMASGAWGPGLSSVR
jgi:drug/metabolite transporter (DMT)-like permease